MAANWLVPPPWVRSRNTAARVTPAAICLSSSSHFPLKLYSKIMKPVALPPGRAKLSTKPAATGSPVLNDITTGIVPDAAFAASIEISETAMIASRAGNQRPCQLGYLRPNPGASVNDEVLAFDKTGLGQLGYGDGANAVD
jgi:hypothetical protein